MKLLLSSKRKLKFTFANKFVVVYALTMVGSLPHMSYVNFLSIGYINNPHMRAHHNKIVWLNERIVT